MYFRGGLKIENFINELDPVIDWGLKVRNSFNHTLIILYSLPYRLYEMVNRSRCLWILEWYMNIDYPMDIVCEHEDGQCIFLMF